MKLFAPFVLFFVSTTIASVSLVASPVLAKEPDSTKEIPQPGTSLEARVDKLFAEWTNRILRVAVSPSVRTGTSYTSVDMVWQTSTRNPYHAGICLSRGLDLQAIQANPHGAPPRAVGHAWPESFRG